MTGTITKVVHIREWCVKSKSRHYSVNVGCEQEAQREAVRLANEGEDVTITELVVEDFTYEYEVGPDGQPIGDWRKLKMTPVKPRSRAPGINIDHLRKLDAVGKARYYVDHQRKWIEHCEKIGSYTGENGQAIREADEAELKRVEERLAALLSFIETVQDHLSSK